MPDRRVLANAIRFLSMDAVQQANSGHPGMPMGMADIAEVLWNDFLRHDPVHPNWPNRDRFVLSNGHGSMLHYSLLHLSGYELTIDDLKNFRQLHSKTPGHPELGYTPGVETTTGPLGQGLANAVGMALAERILADHFNTGQHKIIDHHTYVFAGDGCLMEGISHEACSLAGTLGLGKLIAFWDDNGISIDGKVTGWFTDDTPKRFAAYGWQVIAIDGHNAEQIKAAITKAQADPRPTLICAKTTIGFGAPTKAGTKDTHGAPLGEEEIAAARQQLQWSFGPFEVPDAIYQAWDAKDRGQALYSQWQAQLEQYCQDQPEKSDEFKRRLAGQLPTDWPQLIQKVITELDSEGPKIATRKASKMVLDRIGGSLPELIGGSADLSGSNLTLWSGARAISADNADGNYIYYGVREFGMAAIATGMALHGGIIPYVATFLVFSDYARNALRMAALMGKRNIFVFTHDSIGLGEDGPTHQPIEHLASLRIMPNMSVWRPCDAVETAVAWQMALERDSGPTSLVLSRQALPHLTRSPEQVADIYKGGYVLEEEEDPSDCELILLATGSEVEIACQAHQELTAKEFNVRVVSMPSTDVFKAQDVLYRRKVLPAGVPTVAIEAASPYSWLEFVGTLDRVVGIDSYGESAPGAKLYEHFSLTCAHVVQVALQSI